MRISAAAILLMLAVPSSGGDKIYEWTDAKNVRHYANSPPPGSVSYVERTLDERGHASNAGSGTYEEEGTASSGPARVDITRAEFERTGATGQRLKGEVKNSGTAAASDVRVQARIRDAAQGTDCGTSEIAVNPSVIPPGGTGTFDATLENPCLIADPPPVDVVAAWTSAQPAEGEEEEEEGE